MRTAVALTLLSMARAGMRRSFVSGDLAEQVEAQGSQDSKASEGAHCWCRELEETLAERAREATSEVNFLTTQRNTRHFDNNRLRAEVKQHERDASQHQQSLDQGGALASRAATDQDADSEFHRGALRSVRKALDAVPEGTGEEVRGALQALNQTFAEKLRESQEAHEQRAGAHEEALKAKQEMLRLAHAGAQSAQDRLQAGEGFVVRADAKLNAYSAQQEADASLRAAVGALCGALEEQEEGRQQLRHQALIAISEAKVASAQAAAAQARAGLVLAAGKAGRSVAAVADVVARGGEVESKLAAALTSTVQTGHLVNMGGAHATDAVKAAIASIGKEAESNLEAMQPLFAAVRGAGQQCGKADARLQAALAAGDF